MKSYKFNENFSKIPQLNMEKATLLNSRKNFPIYKRGHKKDHELSSCGDEMKGGIKKMDKKTVSFLLTAMICLGALELPAIAAQENFGVDVNPGETTSSEMGIIEINPSSDIGALISRISNYVEEFVMGPGDVKLWKKVQDDYIEDFTLLVFESGDIPNFDSITDNGAFETSEEVEINGVTGIWETRNIISKQGTTQTLKMVGDTLVWDDGDTVNWVSGNPTTGIIHIEYNGNPMDLSFSAPDGTAPLNEEILSYFGGLELTSPVMSVALDGPGSNLFGGIIDGTPVLFIEPDKNISTYEFDENVIETQGFSVVAIDGEVLSILPAGTYDIYGLI